MGQRHAPQQRGGGKARRVAAGAAAQRHHAAAAVEAVPQDTPAQGQPRLRGLGRLPGGQQIQRDLQPRSAQAVQHQLAVQGADGLIRRQRPAADGGHLLPQQRPGAAHEPRAHTHGAVGAVQLCLELFHRHPPRSIPYYSIVSQRTGLCNIFRPRALKKNVKIPPRHGAAVFPFIDQSPRSFSLAQRSDSTCSTVATVCRPYSSSLAYWVSSFSVSSVR